MKRSNLVIAIAVVGLFSVRSMSLAQDHNQHHPKQEKATTKSQEGSTVKYSCPMHPEVTSDKPGDCPKCGMTLEKMKKKEAGMSEMMGKPTFGQSVEGMKVQLWLMPQDEHKKMMAERMKDSSNGMMSGHGNMDEGMKHDMKEKGHGTMDKGMMHDMKDDKHSKTMEAMMAGTHHVMVQLSDEKTGEEISDGEVEIQVNSPSQKNSSVKLMSMMKHYGGGLTLEEKGSYSLTVKFKVGENVEMVDFVYDVK